VRRWPAEEILPPGHVLGGRYRIDRKIGSGGMGVVYAAEHLALKRKVALKVIGRQHTVEPRMVARFRREARVASQLRHENVVEVLDLGQAEQREYLSMEFLEGLDLCDAIHLAEGYAADDAIPILDQVLKALEAAHEAGLVHRDLKPENVFLAQQPDGTHVVKLLDFGVVKVMEEGAQQHLTRTGTVVGTPEYMAPEQATTGEVDHRSDLYAVGCIAYAMFTGKPPFVDKSVLLVMAGHVRTQPKLPSQARKTLQHGAAIDRFVMKALEKDPAKRYQTATDMRNALDALAAAVGRGAQQRKITLPGMTSTRPVTNEKIEEPIIEPTAELRARHVSPLALVLAALGGALVAVVITWLLVRGHAR
jgi:serine/threonine-protein kinase